VKYQLDGANSRDHPSLAEAIAYWEEAVQDAVKDESGVTNSVRSFYIH